MENSNPFGASQNAAAPNNNQPLATSQPPKKSHLGLILGLCGGGVVLIAGIVVTLILLLGGGVSKQDFREAAAQTDKIISLANDMKNANPLNGDNLSDGQLNDAKDLIKTYRADLKTAMDKLADMKAIKHDETAQNYFADLKTVYEKYDQNSELAAKYFDEAGPALIAMTDFATSASNLSETDVDSLKAFAQTAHDVATKSQTVNTGNSAIDNAFAKVAAAFESYADAFDKYLAGDTSAASEITATQSDLSAAMSDISDAMDSVNGDETADNFKAALNKLDEYLADKARE
jgi:hypothetical protein